MYDCVRHVRYRSHTHSLHSRTTLLQVLCCMFRNFCKRSEPALGRSSRCATARKCGRHGRSQKVTCKSRTVLYSHGRSQTLLYPLLWPCSRLRVVALAGTALATTLAAFAGLAGAARATALPALAGTALATALVAFAGAAAATALAAIAGAPLATALVALAGAASATALATLAGAALLGSAAAAAAAGDGWRRRDTVPAREDASHRH